MGHLRWVFLDDDGDPLLHRAGGRMAREGLVGFGATASPTWDQVAQLSSCTPAEQQCCLEQLQAFPSGQVTPRSCFPGGFRDDKIHSNGHLFKMMNPLTSFHSVPFTALLCLSLHPETLLESLERNMGSLRLPFPLLSDLAAVPGRGWILGRAGKPASMRGNGWAFALSGSVHRLLRTPEAPGGLGTDTWGERQDCRTPKQKAASEFSRPISPDTGHFGQSSGWW